MKIQYYTWVGVRTSYFKLLHIYNVRITTTTSQFDKIFNEMLQANNNWSKEKHVP